MGPEEERPVGGTRATGLDITDYECTEILESRQWHDKIGDVPILCTHTERYTPKKTEAE